MGLAKGPLSFRVYLCQKRAADRDAAAVSEALKKFRFRGLGEGGPSAGDEAGGLAAIGWVSAHNMLDTELTEEKVGVGRFMVFALRRDQRKIPQQILKAQVELEERAEKEALGLEKLSYDKRRDIKRRVRDDLAAKTPPQTRASAVYWDPRGARVYLGATAERANEDFRGLFKQTFDLDLTPLLPGPLATVITGDESACDRATLVSLVPDAIAVAGQ